MFDVRKPNDFFQYCAVVVHTYCSNTVPLMFIRIVPILCRCCSYVLFQYCAVDVHTSCSNTVPLLFIRTIPDSLLCRHEKFSIRYSVNIASETSPTHEGRHAGGLTDYYNHGCRIQLTKYRCYSDMGFPISKTLVIWASVYYLSDHVGGLGIVFGLQGMPYH